MKDIILFIQTMKLLSHLSLSREKLFCVIFCPFLCISGFLMFHFYLRTIQLLHIIFLHLLLVLLRGLPHYRNLFKASPTLRGPILWNFWVHFGYPPLFLSAAPFSKETVNVPRKNSQHVFLCLGHYQVFQADFRYIRQWLEKCKIFS